MNIISPEGNIINFNKRLVILQEAYEPLRKLKRHLEGSDTRNPSLHPSWTRCRHPLSIGIVDGLVCRVVRTPERQLVQVMVPFDKAIRLDVLRIAHDVPMSGHSGIMKTTHRLLSHFYWPGITSDLKRYIKGCSQCQRRKSPRPVKYETALRPTIPSSINARVGIDLVGPLPLTESTRSQYVCVMIDYFSKWPEAVPIKDKSANSVAKAIYNGWYCRHGIPYEIHTDQGPEFTNELLKRLNVRMGVESRFTTPYNPQSNGEVERFNRTLVDSISAYVSQCPGTWDRYLAGALFAYRSSPHPATGETPFMLMHGREARLPLDVIQSSATELLEDLNEYKTKLTIDLQKAHMIVRQRLEEAARNMKRQRDSRIRDPQTFLPGDKVLVYHPQPNRDPKELAHSQKFKGKWKGPYEVIENRFGDFGSVYKLKDLETKREFTMNVNKIRRLDSQSFCPQKLHLPISRRTETVRTPVDQMPRWRSLLRLPRCLNPESLPLGQFGRMRKGTRDTRPGHRRTTRLERNGNGMIYPPTGQNVQWNGL